MIRTPRKAFLPTTLAVSLFSGAGLLSTALGPAALAQQDPSLGLNGLPRGLQMGDVPDFVFETFDGEEVNPLTNQGKLVVLDFWATWCGPCVASMPHMKQLYAFYHDYGVEVYGLSLDDNAEIVEQFDERHDLPWHLSQGEGPNLMASDFAVTGIPQCFILGPDGALLWSGHPMALTDDVMAGFVQEHLGVDVPSMSERAAAVIEQANAALDTNDLPALMQHVQQLASFNVAQIDDVAILEQARALYDRVQDELEPQMFINAIGEDDAKRIAWVQFYRAVAAPSYEDEHPDQDVHQPNAD